MLFEPDIPGYGETDFSLNFSPFTSVLDDTWVTKLNLGPIRDTSIALFDINQDGFDEIFVGTSKALDENLQEIRPAGLAVLKHDGTLLWTTVFPAIAEPDQQTGLLYYSTSVSTPPSFADLTGDGQIEIVIGVGADTMGEAGPFVVGQPGDKGGIYALRADGSILWYHETHDLIGGTSNQGDGRPDGVYGAPVVFDITGDGQKEVIINGWDQSTKILRGIDGTVLLDIHLADTIWSTPKIADITNDGHFEILVSADITQNIDAGTETGGIFHVLRSDGSQNIPGFDQPVGNATYTMLRGKYEEQALWSSPQAVDLDGDGTLEIIYGTGNYLHDERGSYIRVWNNDGTPRFTLETQGRTFSTPLIADLTQDGRPEIIAATLDGYIHGWDFNGNPLFTTQPKTFFNATGNPIFSTPVTADLTGNGKLEILFSQGAQIVVLDHQGRQLSDPTSRQLIFEFNKGSPAIKDINNNGTLNIISGGNTPSHDQAVVFSWANPFHSSPTGPELNNERYQEHQSTGNITNFVNRFYETVLQRTSEPGGKIYWTDNLNTGVLSGADVAKGFIFSPEFFSRDLSNEDYVNTLYQAFFNRAPDSAGYNDWITRLNSQQSRESVLEGFIFSQEFRNLCQLYGIRAY